MSLKGHLKGVPTDYSHVCRGCLVETSVMKNMHEWGLSEDFFSVTDINMDHANELTQWLCIPCEELLASSRKFRVQCQRSDRFLKEEFEKSKKRLADSLVNINADDNKEIQIINQMEGNTLNISIITLNKDEKIYLPCPDCSFKTIKKDHLSRHLNTEHRSNIKVYLAYYCPYEGCNFKLNNKKNKHFLSRKYLNQHLFKIHLDKPYSCVKCKQKFCKENELIRHTNECSVTFMCGVCNISYKNNETLLVHLLRKHPDIHKQYKSERKSIKKQEQNDYRINWKKQQQQQRNEPPESAPSEIKKVKLAGECDSPKRNFATQTFDDSAKNIKNDITLPSWHSKNSDDERNFNNTETQTVFEDLISLKSQTSEDSIFFSETVSLSDFSTQTCEFGLSRKETITSQTQTRINSPDDTKQTQTQTCLCYSDSPKFSYKLFDGIASSPSNLTSTETQTMFTDVFKSDVLSIETQTNFDDVLKDGM